MIVEELIAKLGLKFTGGNDAAKFIRELEKIKKAAREAGRGLKFKVDTPTTGLRGLAADAERAARAMRKMREEASRASRVRYRPGSMVPPGGDGIGPGPRPGRVPGTASGAAAARASEGGGGLSIVATLGSLVASINRFGSLEAAQIELAKTAEKTKKETQPAVDRFLTEGPKYGTTGKSLVGAAAAYAAAGIDYASSVASAELTAKAAKAGTVEIDAAAQAAIVFMQNLGVKVSELERAFDYSIKGGKLGKAEFKESASVMPELAASGSKIGLKGLTGVRDIVAALTVVREGTATTAQAADFLRDFMEKMSAPVTVKAFKKAGIDLEKELKNADKNGVSRLDKTLELAARYTKGDAFREAELFGDLQARNAMSGLIKKNDKYQEFKKTIENEAPGTMQADLVKTMDGVNSSVERFGATLDRVAVRVGELLAPGARGVLDAASAGDQARVDGKGSTADEVQATVSKLNRLLGTPPTYHRIFGGYGASMANFGTRFDASAGGKGGPSFMQPRPTGMQAPTFGNVGDRMNWLSQGAAKGAGVTTTYTDSYNDKRTQTASVTVHATGLAEVAAQVKTAVQSGLSSMGASIVKGQSASTGASTAP